QVFRRRRRIIFLARLAFRHGDVAGGFHESSKLFVGDISPVEPEAIDIHAMDRTRVFHGLHPAFRHSPRITRAHGKLPTRNPDHAVWRVAGWRSRIGSRG